MYRGLDDRLEIVEDSKLSIDLVKSIMGDYHSYYAKIALERVEGARGIIALVGGEPGGAAVCYPASGRVKLGVVYYIVVDPRFRGRGLGRRLVLECENIAGGADFYVATIELRNAASARMFASIGYNVTAYHELAETIGWRAVAAIHHATCSYEEDLIAYKPGSMGADSKLLSTLSPDDYKDLWWEICYKPWMERRYGIA